MIERTYKCNLCKDAKAVHDLYGLYWGGNTVKWHLKNVHDCENHICKSCAQMVANIVNNDKTLD